MKDKLIRYIVLVALIVILSLSFFVFKNTELYYYALVLISGLVVSKLLYPNSHKYHLRQRDYLLMMLLFGIAYLLIYYALGFMYGFYKNPYAFSFAGLIYRIIPFSMIIISSEWIREIYLISKDKVSSLLVFIVNVLADIVLYWNLYSVGTLDGALEFAGFILAASIASNFYYQYTNKVFGKWGNILFRWITFMYGYIMPVVPDVYIYFRTFLRLLCPYFMYLFVNATFKMGKKKKNVEEKKHPILTTLLIALMVIFVMLISCKFYYSIMVVGSGSMTGTINMGDVVLYKAYDGKKPIEVGTIIVFQEDRDRIIHRVVDVKYEDGQYRYYTKGDYNDSQDPGYRVADSIVGFYEFRIPSIGYPTIIINDFFNRL